jgi:hypothetical protein
VTSLDTSKAIRIGGRISLCATQTSIYVALSSAPGTGSLRDPFLNAIIFMVAVILLILLFPLCRSTCCCLLILCCRQPLRVLIMLGLGISDGDRSSLTEGL